MKIIQKVLIKQIITDKSRKKLQAHFNQHKMQLEQECQQLQFEQKKMEKNSNIPITEISHRFELETKKRQDKIALIDFKLEQVDMLEIGSELVEKEVEALVEVSIGLEEKDLFEKKAIILKDGIVVRIDK